MRGFIFHRKDRLYYGSHGKIIPNLSFGLYKLVVIIKNRIMVLWCSVAKNDLKLNTWSNGVWLHTINVITIYWIQHARSKKIIVIRLVETPFFARAYKFHQQVFTLIFSSYFLNFFASFTTFLLYTLNIPSYAISLFKYIITWH